VPHKNNLSALAEHLAAQQGVPNWPDLARNLAKRLGCSVVFEPFNLTSPAIDRLSIRALAIELGVGASLDEKMSFGSAQALVAGLERNIHEAFGNGRSKFLSNLDPDILGVAGSCPDRSLTLYNWLVGGANPRSRQWRIQAARVFPALMISLTSGPLGRSEATLEQVIDQGEPLVQALREVYGVQKSVARRAFKIPASLLVQWKIRLGVLLRGLTGIPPEKYPSTDAEWGVYAQLLSVWLPKITGRPATSFFNAAFLPAIAKRGWGARQKLERLGLNEEGALLLRQFIASCSRILTRELAKASRVAESCAAPVAGKVLDEALLAIGVEGLAEGARKWPACLGRSRLAHQKWSSLVLGKRWLAVIDEPFECANGCRVVALAGAKELVKESTIMKNCADTYVNSCMSGQSYLFSVRGDNDVRLAMAEVQFKLARGTNTYQAVTRQLKGPGNRPASREAVEAHAAFTRYLETVTVQDRITQVIKEIEKLRYLNSYGDAAIVARRIEHEIERGALSLLEIARLSPESLLAEAESALAHETRPD
jgi:hypothetical protein